ncbi:unnamed protein product [Tilletia laevis]|uniref:Dickkopf N-terminal cysteine-rich domain-containing protein n=1 Tax=Tilletia laevis TaxID=157183 RepID=A0A9N8QD75_9BASI|nr:unnamed protein product [Tilletia caries]CAD6898148.1 unnamed protein product [Tilletia controversa]CAD6929718.1 unnamed protein product [Tilletia laevis]CAD6985556.1 unnamed protein product [Tilletia controversa]
MISFIKKQGPKFALLLLASQLLTAVAASPFDLDSRALVSRARGGKYVGSSCQVDSECYSASCATGDDGVTRTCQRQLPGGPCFENSNCDTRQCDLSAGICKASAVNGLCTNYYDCDGWEQGTVTCQNKKCKIQDSKACTQSNQCASGFCNNKICRRRPQAPNSPCFVDGECLSGDCAAITASQCTNPDGSFAYCPGTTDQHCTRYALGHSCANNGECQEGFCRSGKCVASKDGDACSEQYQCTGPSVCGNGKCYTPSNATLHPNDVCDIGSQCLSGRCVTDQLQKDSYGVNTVTLKNQYPARCDYLANGQTSCRSFTDCSTGLCQSGTCNLGKDGDRCQVNYQCENLCSSDGVCYTPAKSNAQGQGEPCKTDDQCLSRSCLFKYDSVTRPRLGSDFPIGVSDTSCGGSVIGQGCRVDGDCSQGSCSNGTCSLLSVGASCEGNTQCDTGMCTFQDPSASSGTCVLAEYHTQCSRDDVCFSGKCVKMACPYSKDPNACVYYGCQAVALGGTCRQSNYDCYPSGQSCSSDNNARRFTLRSSPPWHNIKLPYLFDFLDSVALML